MPPTSASLLERLSDRADSDAWSRMVDLYSPLIRSWLGRYGLAEPDVDDISQTVLSAVVANLPQFQHNGRRRSFSKLASDNHGQQPPRQVPLGAKTAGFAGGQCLSRQSQRARRPR